MERDRRYGWGEDRDRWGRDERYGYGREHDDDDRWRGGYVGGARGRDDWRSGGSYITGSSRDDDWRSREHGPYGRQRDDYGRGEYGRGEHGREREGGMGSSMRGMMERGREMMGRDRDESGGGYGRMGLGEHGGWGSSHGMPGYGAVGGWGSDRQREGWGASRYGSGTFGMGGHETPGGYGGTGSHREMGGYGATSGYGGGYGHGAMGGYGVYGRSEGRDWDRNRFEDRDRFEDRGRLEDRGRYESREYGERDRDRDEGGFFQRMGEGIRNVFGMGDRERGPFFGRGPKGYKRSDERIREEVSEVIARQGWIDASDVEVKVQNGDVTLAGTVHEREHKRRLEMMIEDIPGVDDVRNELRIKRPETSSAGTTYPGESGSESRGRNARSS